MEPKTSTSSVAAVVFDLDGVLVETEEIWLSVRECFASELGRKWNDEIQSRVMGMGPQEWPSYMRESLQLNMSPEEVRSEILRRISFEYQNHLPVVQGATETVRRIAARWPVGLASSSDRVLIDQVLAELDLSNVFSSTVSSEEVPHGKPSPDVYLAAARALRVDPASCVAVEDSANGIRPAQAAGMAVIAIPNASFPPADDALSLADRVVSALRQVDETLVQQAWSGHSDRIEAKT